MGFIRFVLTLTFFFFSGMASFAQFKPIYFVGQHVVQDSTRATSYGIYGKLTGEDLYALKIFDLNNNLKTTGTFQDENLKIAHGVFVYYEDVDVFNRIHNASFILKGKTRFISVRGSFVNNAQNGRWINFFPDGKIMNVTTYLNGVKYGFFGTYDRKGKALITGNYVADQKEGEWQYNNGKVKEIYIKGVKQVMPEKKSKNNTN